VRQCCAARGHLRKCDVHAAVPVAPLVASATGTRTAARTVTDNAPGRPQTAPLTGTGTNPPLAIRTQSYSCANNACDISGHGNPLLNNLFRTTFEASGGAPPYTWSGNPPAGLRLRPSGLLLGAPTTLGTQTFAVTDSAGATATGTFSLTVTNRQRRAPAARPAGN
jgi:hypothetical protein